MKIVEIQLSLKTRQGRHAKIFWNAVGDKEFGIVNHKGSSFVHKGRYMILVLIFEFAQHLVKFLGKGTAPSPFLGLIGGRCDQRRQGAATAHHGRDLHLHWHLLHLNWHLRLYLLLQYQLMLLWWRRKRRCACRKVSLTLTRVLLLLLLLLTHQERRQGLHQIVVVGLLLLLRLLPCRRRRWLL